MIHLKTIDAHVGGSPLRLVVGGFPVPRGGSMLDKSEWAAEHVDALRRVLLLEPRGHADMHGALLTEPVTPGAHAGVLFMHNDGFSDMSGTGVIAATTIALERKLLIPGGDGGTVVFDTTAGTVTARATVVGDRVARVAVVCPPSFVLHGGVTIKIGGRVIRADVAFGGSFFAIVDGESIGIPVDAEHASELRRASRQLSEAIASAVVVVHPLDTRLGGIHGIIFTGPPHDSSAGLRAVSVVADRALDRTASGSGAAAILSVLDAIGLVADESFVCEGLIGTTLTVRVAGRTMVGDYPALVPEFEGSAWITGDHDFIVNDGDSLRAGFRI